MILDFSGTILTEVSFVDGDWRHDFVGVRYGPNDIRGNSGDDTLRG